MKLVSIKGMANSQSAAWWHCPEGWLLAGQSLLISAFLFFAGWVYYKGFYAYVPPANEKWRCATGEAAALMASLLLIGYSVPFWLWQLALVKRRRRGLPPSWWCWPAFVGALLPIMWLIG
ncbi:hypothetical protein [Hymenobacter ruricola]|uniref:Uncharacterized protein n=1 Tax=Hymenobacter ruricola TaxID=2791023 RepID=A0ABS0I1V6_9BACT|nr:hypothetical protein [Hymenobacter ruricola]MBF9220882.1 hypothetical protein [Hymenobacter ruricola]